MKRYPSGIDLIQNGQCPAGAGSPMACMFCSSGHMLECHFPYDCQEAQCAHLSAYSEEFDESAVFAPDPDFGEEFGAGDLACEICGCTEFAPCPGGCAWSKRYWNYDRAVCTRCESFLITLDLNMAVLRIWETRSFIPEVILEAR